MQSTELWRPVEGSPDYEVSDMGRVRSPRTILKPRRNGKYGYLSVPLGRSRQERVHRLVAAAFLGDVAGMDVDHINGVTSDNRAVNLRIVTHAENMRLQRERKPECRRGHSFDDAYWSPNGRRNCRTCLRIKESRRPPRAKRTNMKEN